MKAFFRLLVFLLLVGGWGLSAAALHIVQAPGRVIIVPKDHLSFSEIYVDTRNWTMDDVANHPTVVKRLLERGKADALQHVAPDTSGEKLVRSLQDGTNVTNAAAQQKRSLERKPPGLRPDPQPPTSVGRHVLWAVRYWQR